MTNPIDELIEKLLSSAKAFRENWIYTQDGDPVLLAVQAEELEQAASTLTSLQERNRKLEEALAWAVPLAAQHLETIASERARAGHTALGTIRSSLYDSEVEDLNSARALLGAAA